MSVHCAVFHLGTNKRAVPNRRRRAKANAKNSRVKTRDRWVRSSTHINRRNRENKKLYALMSFFGWRILPAAPNRNLRSATQWPHAHNGLLMELLARYYDTFTLSLRAESHRICPVRCLPIHDVFNRDDFSSVAMLCCGCVDENHSSLK